MQFVMLYSGNPYTYTGHAKEQLHKLCLLFSATILL